MTAKGSRGTSYGVYVRFRRSRLPLRRGISQLEEAFAIADQLRAERPHKRDDVFVARESDGMVMQVQAAPRAEGHGTATGRTREKMQAAVDRARDAETRAKAALTRLDAVVSTLGDALARDAAPASLRESHARTRAASELSARSVAAIARTRETLEALIRTTPTMATRDPERLGDVAATPAPPEV